MTELASRAMLDKYQRKVAAGYYEQLRPRALRERLDEVCYMMYQICSGKLVQPAAVDRLNLERSRAYGGLSSSEEQHLHEQRLQRIENADDATLTGAEALHQNKLWLQCLAHADDASLTVIPAVHQHVMIHFLLSLLMLARCMHVCAVDTSLTKSSKSARVAVHPTTTAACMCVLSTHFCSSSVSDHSRT